MHYVPLTPFEEQLGKAIVNAAYKVHKAMGPGLLEKIYERCMEHELTKSGYEVARQITIPICYDGVVFDDILKLDILLDNKVIIELKAMDQVNPVWRAQLLSHLKLTGLRLGYLINFNVPLIKEGIQRFVL
jgi:GxxExxY protein